jgi:hypothetical protein
VRCLGAVGVVVGCAVVVGKVDVLPRQWARFLGS